MGSVAKVSAGSWTYRNPLFSFMYFAAGNDFHPDDVKDLYNTTPVEYLPAIAVIMDMGIILNMRLALKGDLYRVVRPNWVPEFSAPLGPGEKDTWVFSRMASEDETGASTLSALYVAIIQHLQKCQLMRPVLSDYLKPLLGLGEGVFLADALRT
jgi:hypothetical protein